MRKNLALIIIICLTLSSCVNWEEKDVAVVIQTDVNVDIIATYQNGNPMQNQIINWSIHLYNVTTNTDSDQQTGQVITNSNGEATLPVYQCQLNASKIVRIIAQTSGQANNQTTPITVSFNDAKNAMVNDLAVINVTYPLVSDN